MANLIEDYALVGDGHTAALISRDGSVDWLCWPRFDSGACFAALVGTPEHGRWLLAPAEDANVTATTRRYRGDTLILETDYESADGAVTVIDFMPPDNGWSELVRIVVGRRGAMKMRTELVLRFDYGCSIPWVTQLSHEAGMKATAGPDTVVLRTPVPLSGENLRATVAEFTVHADERVPFALAYSASHLRVPPARDPLSLLALTENYWLEWSARCQVQGRYASAVRRSLITLKALTYEPTGGIVAAPTTSLPEHIGGTRNWDYRYCWLRDATITLLALMRGGHYDEARAWRSWLGRVMAGSPEQIQIMYGIAGERRLPEIELDWLPGYEESKPVRVGNGAANQLQLDVFGEVMGALHVARVGGLQADDTVWSVECSLLAHLETIWREPDEGIWETRGGRRHFTFSKVMAWVAFDCALKSAEKFGLPGPLERWRELRDEIHADVCEKGWNPAKQAFTQSYGSDELDASILMLPIVGFLPPSDSRIASTVAAVERELLHDGLVLRYRTTEYDDGLPPGEGTFLACSFWLVDNLALLGRLDDAHRLFRRLLALSNDLGLLAEEYDPVAGRLVGNFPQAFSHVALVHTAMNLMHHEDQMVRAAGHPVQAETAAG
ncbi:glycoside hydrolase family 15 protein [Paraburkholderia megapolitana]|uniref:glycoside hydrolase family 15 protein n=1 Tax=Paraburkholderia megapolitana TaxID=420953 RepID=UPI0038B9C1B4